MPDEKDTLHADGENIAPETAGGYRGELEDDMRKEALGDGAADEPLRQGSLGRKEPKDTVGTNPKRQENSRPS